MSDRGPAIPAISRDRFDAVIFDLDGVVTRTAEIHAAAWKQLFDQFLEHRAGEDGFRPFDAEEDYRAYVDGKPRYDGVESFLGSRGIELPYGRPDDAPDRETVCGLGNRKNVLFLESLERLGAKVYEDSIALIKRLRRKGFRTAVVSSSKNCVAVLEGAGIAGLFEVKIDGTDAATMDLSGKPAPDIFLEAARRLDVEPARAVVFEDAVAGVQAGKRGGFGLVVGVDRGGSERALREAGADVVSTDLLELDPLPAMRELPSALEVTDRIVHEMMDGEAVLFLDYDGTLTPIVSRPEDAKLPAPVRGILREIARQITVAIISGRGLGDVREMVGIEEIYYAGSHGFEIAGPGDLAMENAEAAEALSLLDDAEGALKGLLGGIEGAQIERKRFTIAVHYRNVPDAQAGEVEQAVDEAVRRHQGLRKKGGKKVFELQPDVDWDKGRALSWLLEKLDLNRPEVRPIYIGDDLTDEDAFRAVDARGTAVVVGEEERPTAAHYRLRDTEEVRDFLGALMEAPKQRKDWSLVYEGYDPEQEGLREALCTLGNGYFATRGASPESHADGVHYPGTYLAGGYNRLRTVIAGRTIENEDLVNIPNWLCLHFSIDGGEWFDPGRVEILSYRQTLDMRRAVLHRELCFRDSKNRETRVRERRLVSLEHMHLAAQQVVITPLNWSGTIEVQSALDGRVVNEGVERYGGLNKRHLEPVEAWRENDDTIVLKVRTIQSRRVIVEAARIEVFKNGEPLVVERQQEEESGYIGQGFSVPATQGAPVTVEKTLALYTSRDMAVSECGQAATDAVMQAGRFEELLKSHALTWNAIWQRYDMRLDTVGEEGDGDHLVQKILRLYSFHILQTSSIHTLDVDAGMPSRGWHGEAYRGHIFWDELLIFPFLNYRMPQITRALLMYRYRRLDQARIAARELGYRGAMYPWQSGSDGREETQKIHLNPRSGRWLDDNSHLQRHINGAIVYTIWQYFMITADTDFINFYGGEMILEIARFWSSITTYNEERDRYEIRGVMGPDEYHDAYPGADRPGLDNNAYTNIMAVFVLERALDVVRLFHEHKTCHLCLRLGLKEEEKQRWADIVRKMYVPFHDAGIISQFEGYEDLEEFDWEGYTRKYGDIHRLDRILEAEGDTVNRYKASKQADVLMLFYLFSSDDLGKLFERLGYPFERETIPRNVDYYLNRTSNGSSLSRVVHSWVAARGDRKRSWDLFRQALETDALDAHGGTTREGVHLGAMAGCVDIIQRCYSGLEPLEQLLRINPLLPESLRAVNMRIRYRGHWLELDIAHDKITIHPLSVAMPPVEIEVFGQRFWPKKDEPIEVPLRRKNRGQA